MSGEQEEKFNHRRSQNTRGYRGRGLTDTSIFY